MSLPKGFKRLEYIQSSGTQFINTSLPVASGLDISFDFQCTTVASGTQFLFYGSDGWKNKGFGLYLSSSSAGAFCYGSGVGTGVSVAGAQRHTYKQNQNSLYIDGNLVKQLSAQTFSGSAPIILFAGSEGSSVGVSPVKGKLYSCQIRNNGTLVRDFVPCQNASGAVGLWDDANSVFYGNAGSGAFAAGPVIQAPGKPSGLAHALSVRLVWSAVSGAISYNIYRDGSFVGSSNLPTFVDVSAAENQTYVYAVSAVGQGGEGEPATLTIYTKAGYFEYKPLIESANFQ